VEKGWIGLGRNPLSHPFWRDVRIIKRGGGFLEVVLAIDDGQCKQ